MFTRPLAVSLGEVRQPSSSAQCLRAASTAGALLAGYFPHLRGAFRFPQHLAGVNDRNVQTRYPQIASLFSAQDSSGKEAALECAGNTGAPTAAKTSSKDVQTDMDSVRTSVVATLNAREYGTKMYWLERTCLELRASNQQLQTEFDTAQARFEKTRELNRRLCREVNEVRTERSSALEEVDRANARMERSRQEVDKLRLENAALHEALQASKRKVSELTCLNSELNAAREKIIDVQETGPDPATLVVPMSLEQLLPEDANQASDGECTCGGAFNWGCSKHRVYSENLLLAHRTIAARIQAGPPGLELPELEAPPGLTACDNRICLRPRLQA